MEQLVRVQKCNDDGTAQVIHVRQSACSGDCHKCSGCGAAKETLLLTAHNPIGARPGQLVTLRSSSGPVLLDAAVLYMMPLVLFFVGYLLLELLCKRGALGGCLAFVLGILIAKLYDRVVASKRKNIYTITGFGQSLPGEPYEGDNDLD
jgi:sigma-E factor negative regulatory protein RseC